MADSPDTILFIHGLWMTPRSWENFASLREPGLQSARPGLPGTEGEVEALRGALALRRARPEDRRRPLRPDHPPVGRAADHHGATRSGTITQILLSRGLGAAAVGFAPGTVKGVPDLPLSTLRASFAVLDPFKRGRGIPFSKRQFAYAMANTLDREESDRLWERYAVPAASGVLFDVALATISQGRRRP